MTNEIVAIVVTYNRKVLLKKCLQSLIKQKYSSLDIIIVDNNSTDGTKDFIVYFLELSNVTYVNTGENIGGAGGFNFGMKLALEKNYEYLWLMDDDCIPTENALIELMNANNKLNGNYGYLSSKVLWKDNSLCKMNIQKIGLRKKIHFDCDLLTKIKFATFVSFFLKADTVKKHGYPIRDFFIWADDIEYSNRISKNISCYYVPLSIVYHDTFSNCGSNIAIDSIDKMWRYSLSFRNEFYLYRKNGLLYFMFFVLSVLKTLFVILVKSKDNKLKRVKVLFSSIYNGFFFNPKIEKY